MHAIILFAHGSRDPLWHKPIQAVAQRMSNTSPEVLVRCAYLELTEPDLLTVVAELAQAGATHVRVLPMFLGVGRHAREDLPELIQALRAAHPQVDIQCQPAVGEQQLAAGFRRLAGADLGQRVAAVEHPLDHRLDLAAGVLHAMQPRADHPGVVEHQQVARAQFARQIDDMGIAKTGFTGFDHQHPPATAGRGRGLGYQFGRQDVREITELHGRRNRMAATRLL